MKKTVLKLWTENCWKSIFPETYANLVKRANGKTVEESLVAVESVKTELSNKVDNLNEKLDTKLNKVSMPVPSVYGGVGDSFVSVAYTKSPTKNTLCYRDGRGAVKTVEPVEDDDAVTRKYLDIIKAELQAQLVGKVDYLGLFNDESGETLWTNTEHITAGDYFISAIEDGNTGAKIGDIIIARVDHPSRPADWDVIEANHEVLPYEAFCDVQRVEKIDNAIWIFYGSGYAIVIPIEAGDGIVVEPNASYDAIRISSTGSSGGVPFVRLA